MSSAQIATPVRIADQFPDFRRVYEAWEEALSRNDIEALLALYAPDAILESPLILHLMGTEQGICRGHAELGPFFRTLAQRKPAVRRYYRTAFLMDGKSKMMWEYPRATPDGDQMDFVEVMELRDGLIQKHRVYWGWFGFGVLQRDDYRS